MIFSGLCRAGWSSIKNCNTPTRDTTPADLLRGWFGRAALIESPPFVTSFRLDSIATPRRRRRTRYPTYLPNHPRLFYHNWWWVRYVEWSRTVTVSCAVENMSRRKQARPIRLLEDEENNASAVADTAAAVASPSFPTASAIGKSTFVTYLYADDTCFIIPTIDWSTSSFWSCNSNQLLFNKLDPEKKHWKQLLPLSVGNTYWSTCWES